MSPHDIERTKINEHELAGAGPRDAARGRVNAPALPRETGRGSPLWIND